MRVFVAIDLPEHVEAELEALQNGFRTGRSVPGLSGPPWLRISRADEPSSWLMPYGTSWPRNWPWTGQTW